IMHDREVDRTTNGSGILGKMDSSALDALDAGSWFSPEFKGERIPRLKEYLQWLNGKAKVYFDVKAGSMKQLVALVRETGFENDSFFWFGNKLLLGSFLKYGKDLKLKINAYTPEEVEDAANRYNASIVEMPLAALTPAYIQSCRKHAIRIMIYEKENTAAVFRQILDSDADLVNLDKPGLFVKVRDNAEKNVK
ncbi:MAG: glycerophosphodiester phosphodiesterase family protein, partial [Candidatus Hydrogenedentes bacterium]|nr:glycerophosphodiester phosphodiesterase family protein [Candidatus Hydrogenedentota bacterium]